VKHLDEAERRAAEREDTAGFVRRQGDRFQDDTGRVVELAKAFLDETKCSGARGLSETAEGKRLAIRDRAKPPPTAGTASP
jgi:hypothetical protein